MTDEFDDSPEDLFTDDSLDEGVNLEGEGDGGSLGDLLGGDKESDDINNGNNADAKNDGVLAALSEEVLGSEIEAEPEECDLDEEQTEMIDNSRSAEENPELSEQEDIQIDNPTEDDEKLSGPEEDLLNAQISSNHDWDEQAQEEARDNSFFNNARHTGSNSFREESMRMNQESHDSYMNYVNENGVKSSDTDPYRQNKADFYKSYNDAKANYQADVLRYHEGAEVYGRAGAFAVGAANATAKILDENHLDPATCQLVKEIAKDGGRMVYYSSHPYPIDTSGDIKPEGLPQYDPDEVAKKLYDSGSIGRVMDRNQETVDKMLDKNEATAKAISDRNENDLRKMK